MGTEARLTETQASVNSIINLMVQLSELSLNEVFTIII